MALKNHFSSIGGSGMTLPSVVGFMRQGFGSDVHAWAPMDITSRKLKE